MGCRLRRPRRVADLRESGKQELRIILTSEKRGSSRVGFYELLILYIVRFIHFGKNEVIIK